MLTEAAEPALANLLNEEELAVELPLFVYGEKQAEQSSGARGIVPETLLESLPERVRQAANESIELFRFYENKTGAKFFPVFQPLLAPLDDAAKNYIYGRLVTALPATRYEQEEWFRPPMRNADPRRAGHYDRMGKQLQKLLVYRNPTSPLGLLRDCFEFALNDTSIPEGVFKSVWDEFRFEGARDWLQRLGVVVSLRNSCIAHAGDVADPKIRKLSEELQCRPESQGYLVGWLELLGRLIGGK